MDRRQGGIRAARDQLASILQTPADLDAEVIRASDPHLSSRNVWIGSSRVADNVNPTSELAKIREAILNRTR
jgi:hypothetical protein